MRFNAVPLPREKEKRGGKRGARANRLVEIFRSIPYLAPLISQSTQRRKHKRREPEEDAYVLFRHPVTQMGQIIDISRGGISFSSPSESQKLGELFELDIFINGASFYLERVPCKYVSECEIVVDGVSEVSRRYGVAFRELTQRQVSQLEYLLRRHTKIEGHTPPYLMVPRRP